MCIYVRCVYRYIDIFVVVVDESTCTNDHLLYIYICVYINVSNIRQKGTISQKIMIPLNEYSTKISLIKLFVNIVKRECTTCNTVIILCVYYVQYNI